MKKWLVPLTCAALVSMMTACAMNDNAARTGPHTQNTVEQGNRQARSLAYGGDNMYHNTTPYYQNRGITATRFDSAMADRVARAADNVPGVTGATAIVSGNDAVVGIRHRMAATDTRQHLVVERQVREAVRAVAPNLNLRVTSRPDMLTRIDNLNNTIRGNMNAAMTGRTAATAPNAGTAGGRPGATAPNGGIMGGPTTVGQNLTNAGADFTALLRDLGRTVTAPFR